MANLDERAWTGPEEKVIRHLPVLLRKILPFPGSLPPLSNVRPHLIRPIATETGKFSLLYHSVFGNNSIAHSS